MNNHKEIQVKTQVQAKDWKEQARKVAKSGIRVFPIHINWNSARQKWDKVPVECPNGFLDASLDVDKFNWSGANGYGMAMGNGFFMIDPDDPSPEGAPKVWMQERGLLDMPTRVHKTVSGGEHYFYRLPEGFEDLPCGQNIVPELDTRGDGGYAAFGEGYEVVSKSHAVVLPVVVCKELLNRWKNKKGGTLVRFPRPWEKPVGAEETLEELLANDGDLKHRWEGGEDGLEDTSRSGFDMSLARRFAMQGCTYDFIAWALMEECEVGTGDERQIMKVAAMCERLSGKDEFDPIDDPKSWGSGEPEEWEPEDAEAITTEPSPSGAGSLAEAVEGVSGLVSELMDYAEVAGRRVGRDHHVAAALCCIAAASKGRFVVDLPNGPTALNLQLVLIAGTGAGKENDRALVQLGAEASGAPDFDDFGSAQGLHRVLADHRSVIWLSDEYHVLMEAALKKTGGDMFKRQLANHAVKAYGLAFGKLTIVPVKDARQSLPAAEHPFLVGFHSTPDMGLFMGAFSTANLRDGVLNRPLMLEGPNHADFHKDDHIAPRQPPKAVVDALDWINKAGRYADDGGLVSIEDEDDPFDGVFSPTVRTYGAGSGFRAVAIEPDAGAKAALKDWKAEVQAKEKELKPTASLWMRAVENAIKVAGVVALGEIALQAPVELKGPVPMVKAHVDWAVKFTRHCLNAQCKATDMHVSDSIYQADMQVVVRALVGCGGKAPQNILTRKTQGLNKRRREEALATLQEIGRVRVSQEPTGGQRKTIFALVGFD